MTRRGCRFCGEELQHIFCDLGTAPPSNSYLSPAELLGPEIFFPLCAFVCSRCLLVQLQQFQDPSDIFSNYAYFSSYSDTWLEHARVYTEQMVRRFGITRSSM